MASTVSGKGIDHYKRHRPLKVASLVYERENCSDDSDSEDPKPGANATLQAVVDYVADL